MASDRFSVPSKPQRRCVYLTVALDAEASPVLYKALAQRNGEHRSSPFTSFYCSEENPVRILNIYLSGLILCCRLSIHRH